MLSAQPPLAHQIDPARPRASLGGGQGIGGRGPNPYSMPGQTPPSASGSPIPSPRILLPPHPISWAESNTSSSSTQGRALAAHSPVFQNVGGQEAEPEIAPRADEFDDLDGEEELERVLHSMVQSNLPPLPESSQGTGDIRSPQRNTEEEES